MAISNTSNTSPSKPSTSENDVFAAAFGVAASSSSATLTRPPLAAQGSSNTSYASTATVASTATDITIPDVDEFEPLAPAEGLSTSSSESDLSSIIELGTFRIIFPSEIANLGRIILRLHEVEQQMVERVIADHMGNILSLQAQIEKVNRMKGEFMDLAKACAEDSKKGEDEELAEMDELERKRLELKEETRALESEGQEFQRLFEVDLEWARAEATKSGISL